MSHVNSHMSHEWVVCYVNLTSAFPQPLVASQTSTRPHSSTDSVVERERWRSSTGLTSNKWSSRSSVQQENTGEARGGRKREQEKQEVGLGGGRSLASKESRKELGGDAVKGKERREGSVRKPLQDLSQSTRRASLGAPQVIINLLPLCTSIVSSSSSSPLLALVLFLPLWLLLLLISRFGLSGLS